MYVIRILLTMSFTWDGNIQKTLARTSGIASFGVLGLLVGELGYEYGVLSEHMYALSSLASILGMFISTTIGKRMSTPRS